MSKQPSDAEILKDSRNNPWMFGMLVDRYQGPLLRKAAYLLRSSDLAEDAVQETFIKIYKYGDKFAEREGASFQSWAYKILANVCYSHLAKKLKDRESVSALDFADLDNYGADAPGKEDASFVDSVFRRLPAKFSRLLSLYFFEDKSYEEIAEIENVSLATVRSGLHRAKKQFKSVAIELS